MEFVARHFAAEAPLSVQRIFRADAREPAGVSMSNAADIGTCPGDTGGPIEQRLTRIRAICGFRPLAALNGNWLSVEGVEGSLHRCNLPDDGMRLARQEPARRT